VHVVGQQLMRAGCCMLPAVEEMVYRSLMTPIDCGCLVLDSGRISVSALLVDVIGRRLGLASKLSVLPQNRELVQC
jgi:hypothetical protein